MTNCSVTSGHSAFTNLDKTVIIHEIVFPPKLFSPKTLKSDPQALPQMFLVKS